MPWVRYTVPISTPESGLNYYRARYFDSSMGRFISEDPLACQSNDANLYRYVFNSPTNLVDPVGLFSITYARLARIIHGAA